MYGFRRTDRGVEAYLGPEVAQLIATIAADVRDLVQSVGATGERAEGLEGLVGLTDTAPPQPDDPALARLFPDAYDDAGDAAEYRRFTFGDLHREKVERLSAMCERLLGDDPQIVLSEQDAEGWLAALNDVRLVLGERVGVTEDNHRRLMKLPHDDPRWMYYQLYLVLTELQESLVDALAGW